MSQPSLIQNTFVVERSYPVPPERVFAAFADPAVKRRWFGERDHHVVEQFEVDFRPGGTERFRYRFKEGTLFPGVAIRSEGTYHEIVPNQRMVTTSAMYFANKMISVALLTIELLPTDAGTDLVCTHQAVFFEGADGPEMREAGWRSLFDSLEKELAR